METLFTSRFQSPIGPLRIAASEKGVAYIELPNASGRGFAGWMKARASGATVVDDLTDTGELACPSFYREIETELQEFLAGDRREFTLPLDLRGTEFQTAVYAEVAKIPYGQSRSYLEIAQAVGRPKAVRAVGAANGANPIPLIVPCHRVIASSGHLQGYAGGLHVKAKLLAMEGACDASGDNFSPSGIRRGGGTHEAADPGQAQGRLPFL